jgi:hypothetical protein
LPVLAWRPVIGLMGLVGLAVALSLYRLIPRQQPLSAAPGPTSPAQGQGYSSFALLMSIGALDTAARMGYLLFLPFLIHALGGTSTTVGLGLALLFIGGALGKATCNWLGQYLGVVGTVVTTEMATALLITATLFVPLTPMLALLPLLGIVLNGTSSFALRHCAGIRPWRRYGTGIRLFLHLRKRLQWTRADCLRRDCRPLQSDIWHPCGGPYSGDHRAFGAGASSHIVELDRRVKKLSSLLSAWASGGKKTLQMPAAVTITIVPKMGLFIIAR